MKAIVDTRILAGLLSAANGIAGRDTPIQMKIIKPDPSSEMGTVKITAYDQTTVCAWEGPAQVQSEGSIALRGSALERFLKVSFKSDATVMIEKKPTNNHPSLRITTARGAHEFDTLSDESFKNIDPGKIERENGDLSALAAAMLRAKSACAGQDDVAGARIALAGVHVALHGHEIHVAGTDGKRLAWSTLIASDHPSVAFAPSPRGYTIPGPLASKIITMIESTAARIDFSENSLVVANDAGTLALRLIDGAYPNYTPLLEMSPPNTIEISKEALTMALERSSAAIGGDERNSTATLIRNEDGLHLVSATSQESSSEKIGDDAGEEAKVSFETSFMRKALSQAPTSRLRMRFGDHTSPIILDNETRPDILLVVMPCRATD
jgi:DNA polymerase III sliding clamp (beta) subunit (PCNA family)